MYTSKYTHVYAYEYRFNVNKYIPYKFMRNYIIPLLTHSLLFGP